MKTLLIMISIAGLMSLGSCDKKKDTDVNALLENPETRHEIYQSIADDPDMMRGFMETMQGNDHAMQMMQGNKMMMSHMMQDGGMQMMMNDGAIMSHMMQMMHENGMMTDECMEAMTKMMTEKGMNMKRMGKMNNKGTMFNN